MKSRIQKFGERIIESFLLLSGTVTSVTVLLIVWFLFKEGITVFGSSPVEEGNTIAINGANPVKELSAEQLKNIFDQEITNWKDVGGANDSIILFRTEDIVNYFSEEEIGDKFQFLPMRISEVVEKTPGVIAFFNNKYLAKDFKGKKLIVKEISASSFLTGKEWFPTAQPASQAGVLPLILGTLWVSLIAIIIALPLGLGTAIYIAEIADERARKIIKPVIELLAGIPSVVYGFFGLVIIVPFIQEIFNLPVGESGLAGSIILGIMALPTIITISEDAIRNTPRSVKEASLALGASQWQTISRVTIPYSISGISAAAILGIGRAIGETMAVLMVTGNAAVIPTNILEPLRTIPATIAAELGEASQGGLHYKTLFALGCILFIITLVINLTVDLISSKNRATRL